MSLARPYTKKAAKARRDAEALRICAHHTPIQLGYIAKAEWAEAKVKSGEKQSQCPTCKRWFFNEEMGKRPERGTR